MGLLEGAGERVRARCAGRGDGDPEPGVVDLEFGERFLTGLNDSSSSSGGGDLDVPDALLRRGDFDLDLDYGRRTGKGELKNPGLLVTPGGARGRSVGQKTSEARELEPLLGEIGDEERSQAGGSGSASES